MINDSVIIVTSGNTIDLRCSKAEAEQLRVAIMQGINGTLSAAPAVQAYSAPAVPMAGAVPPPPPPAPVPTNLPPADWYADPKGEARLRYWDGAVWTDHTAP